jgi:hypothetical protein
MPNEVDDPQMRDLHLGARERNRWVGPTTIPLIADDCQLCAHAERDNERISLILCISPTVTIWLG